MVEVAGYPESKEYSYVRVVRDGREYMSLIHAVQDRLHAFDHRLLQPNRPLRRLH